MEVVEVAGLDVVDAHRGDGPVGGAEFDGIELVASGVGRVPDGCVAEEVRGVVHVSEHAVGREQRRSCRSDVDVLGVIVTVEGDVNVGALSRRRM